MIEKDLLKKLDMIDTKGIWKLNQAKEYLDLIMVQASLGIRQVIKDEHRAVYVSKFE